MLKKNQFFFILLVCASSFGQAVRKYSNELMNIGVDAAALGMANAVTASSDDVNSGYWNPARLVNLEDHQLALTNLGNQSTTLYSNIFSVKVDLGQFRN